MSTIAVSKCDGDLPHTVRCSGVNPSACATSTGMPRAMSALAASGRPWNATPCGGLYPSFSGMSASAPRSRSFSTARCIPARDAAIRGVCPVPSSLSFISSSSIAS
eukprot:31497-Pelagococcus_subviridis.AAC.35